MKVFWGLEVGENIYLVGLEGNQKSYHLAAQGKAKLKKWLQDTRGLYVCLGTHSYPTLCSPMDCSP